MLRPNDQRARASIEWACSVAECSAILRISGEWGCHGNLPRLYRHHMSSGWFHQPDRCLTHGVRTEKMVLCPTHTAVWLVYRDEVAAWYEGYKAAQKSWWLQAIPWWAMLLGRHPNPKSPPRHPFQ